jgi:hypothetical protein
MSKAIFPKAGDPHEHILSRSLAATACVSPKCKEAVSEEDMMRIIEELPDFQIFHRH